MDDLTRPGRKTENFQGGSKKENGRMACPKPARSKAQSGPEQGPRPAPERGESESRPKRRNLGDGVIGPKVIGSKVN